MKVAVTGATGHIGNVVCRTLMERGHRVSALVHTRPHALDDLSIEKVSGHLFDDASLDQLLSGADAVVHGAAIVSIGEVPKKKVDHVNVSGTRRLLKAAARNGVPQFYYLSSIHAHWSPGPDGTMDEKTPYCIGEKLAGDYDISKAAAEQAVIAARSERLKTTVFNPTAVLGPFDFKPGFTGQLVCDLYRGKIPMLTPMGYDWVDVRDVADAVVTSVEKGISNEKFLISGNWESMVDFARLVAEHSPRKAPKYIAPFWLVRVGVPFIGLYSRLVNKPPLYTYESLRTVERGSKNISRAHAESLIDFRPRPLSQSIADCVEWFRQNDRLI